MGQGAYDIVFFDLGGVLVRLGGVPQMQELSGIDDEDEIWRRWLSCPWVRSFERGRCSPDDFAAGVIRDWGLDVSADSFLERFRSWPEALYDGAVELVNEVAGQCRVGCLSNTNQLHWADQGSRWGFADLFEVVFLSYQLEMVKPDRQIFAHVTAALRVHPDHILFLDDNAVNVDQARSVGWAGAVVRGTDEARSALVEFGVLPDRPAGPPPTAGGG
jgi:putative hydrolase of the HAD superfamily